MGGARVFSNLKLRGGGGEFCSSFCPPVRKYAGEVYFLLEFLH